MDMSIDIEIKTLWELEVGLTYGSIFILYEVDS